MGEESLSHTTPESARGGQTLAHQLNLPQTSGSNKPEAAWSLLKPSKVACKGEASRILWLRRDPGRDEEP